MSELVVRGASARGPSRTPRRRRSCCGCGITEADGDAGARRRAALPDPHRAAAPALRRRRGGARSSSCSARRRGGARRCGRSSGRTSRRRSPASPARTEIDLPVACTYDFEVAGAKYLHALDDGEIPLAAAVLRHDVRPPAATGFSVAPVAWHEEASYRLPGARCGGTMMDRYFPNSGWVRVQPRRRSTRSPRFKARAGAADVGRGDRAAAQGSRGGRSDASTVDRPVRRRPRGRRRRALRGLRALPVPRVGAEEPAALAVRRARAAARRPRPTAPSGRRCAPRCIVDPGGDARAARAGPLPAGAAPHASRRRPTAAVRAGRRRSTSTARTWVAVGRGGRARARPRRAAAAAGGRRAARGARRPRRPATSVEPLDGRRRRASSAGRCAGASRSTAWSSVGADVGRRHRALPQGRRRGRERHRLARRPAPAATTVMRPLARRRAHPARPSTTARSSRCSIRRDGAAEAVAGCAQRRHLPGAGRRRGRADVVLSSPIILYDHPADRARERRATSSTPPRSTRSSPCACSRSPTRRRPRRAAPTPRAAAIVDRCDDMPPEVWERLHGAVRSIGPAADARRGASRSRCRGGSPASTPSVDPWTDTVRGRRRRGRPRARRCGCARRGGPTPTTCSSPAWTATVAGVFHDVDGERARRRDRRRRPGRPSVLDWQGRYLYFHPDEVEVAAMSGPTRCSSPGSATSSSATTASASRSPTGSPAGPLPDGVRVADFGIRGVHLAYELLDGYDALVLVDAVPMGEPPGTVAVDRGRTGRTDAATTTPVPLDAHTMSPAVVLGHRWPASAARSSGSLVVGCEPAVARRGHRPVARRSPPPSTAPSTRSIDVLAELCVANAKGARRWRHDPPTAACRLLAVARRRRDRQVRCPTSRGTSRSGRCDDAGGVTWPATASSRSGRRCSIDGQRRACTRSTPRTDGLEGFARARGRRRAGRVDLDVPTPTGRARRCRSSGCRRATRSRTASCGGASTPGASRRSTATSPRMRGDRRRTAATVVRGRPHVPGRHPRVRGRDDDRRASTADGASWLRASRRSTSATSAWSRRGS